MTVKKRSKALALALGGVLLAATAAQAVELSPLETLGKILFFDASLSNPPGQSCASCHAPETGWTGPDSAINAGGAVVPGVVFTRFGNRKPPTVAYAGPTPILHKCECAGGGGCGMGGCDMGGGGMGGGGMGGGGMGGGGMGVDRTFAGGLFWDGRATGWSLGDPLAEQAMGPFLNPLEMNNPNAQLVCLSVQRTGYAVLFEEVWGPGSLDCVKNVELTYERIARSIAAYERSAEVNPFSSKFDVFWRAVETRRSVPRSGIPPVQNINMMNMSKFAAVGVLEPAELMGLVLFNTKGKCANCHWLRPGPEDTPPLLTDFGYHNLGVPKNSENPFYDLPRKWNPDGEQWVDQGLGGFLAKTAGMPGYDYSADVAENLGRHRTPTLRNVDLRPAPEFVKAFGHNGYFKSLPAIVHFYNCRDVLTPGTGAEQCTDMPPAEAPEVAANVNTTDIGNLGLTQGEGMAIIAFLKTLSDGIATP